MSAKTPNKKNPPAATQASLEVRAGQRVTLLGLVVNLALVGVKFFLGIAGRSQALVADAVHSLSDLATDVVVLVGVTLGRKEPDEKHHFGHRRLETLATGLVSIGLAAAGIYIAMNAVLNIYLKNHCQPTWLAALGAALSIVVKESLYQATLRVGRRIKSQAIVANAWHHRSDSLSSVAVLIGVGGALISPRLAALDAWAALIVAGLIIKVAAGLFWSAIKEVSDAAPESAVLEKMAQCALNVEGVLGVHDLKVRSSADLYQMQLHIVVDGSITVAQGHKVARQVEKCLFRDVENLLEVVVHVDPAQEEDETD
ncbi:MAG: cation diffusion facilitator family transporter [Desulfatibacillaceae bacterium]|nr:cation diffusion facilitator family transporter [Desulfatibacillaceae bacterium]